MADLAIKLFPYGNACFFYETSGNFGSCQRSAELMGISRCISMHLTIFDIERLKNKWEKPIFKFVYED